jgi:hypothetical protein
MLRYQEVLWLMDAITALAMGAAMGARAMWKSFGASGPSVN